MAGQRAMQVIGGNRRKQPHEDVQTGNEDS
jgi:hypothetical protein